MQAALMAVPAVATQWFAEMFMSPVTQRFVEMIAITVIIMIFIGDSLVVVKDAATAQGAVVVATLLALPGSFLLLLQHTVRDLLVMNCLEIRGEHPQGLPFQDFATFDILGLVKACRAIAPGGKA